jgi:hypothetical protein
MYVWGEGSHGQLGQGRFNKFPSSIPVFVDVLEKEKVTDCAWCASPCAGLTTGGEGRF